MTEAAVPTPAAALADANPIRWPNEAADYRAARNRLLAREIELRRAIEAVAEQRRQLPPGAPVTGAYSFRGVDGPATLDDLFGAHDTLVVYAYMFGPQRTRPCPMCTSLLAAWDGEVPDLTRRVALAVTARSPLERLPAFKAERGWQHLPLFEDVDGAFSRDYRAIGEDGGDVPQFMVFTRRDGTIRLFWANELSDANADPGQDPRDAPELMPLWTILDATPHGRGADFYPQLSY